MKGVIYCRVSSKEQTEGTSLASQQAACEEYARIHDIEIAKVFIEEGESAKFADRTQLLELIEFCRERKRQLDVLLVWKVDRFARNVADHFNVKATLNKYGVRILSVTEPIDANPEGKLMETILAGFAQFDNDVRAMRTVQGMRRKIQEGIFPWNPPLGYKSVNQTRTKKTRPDEPDQPLFGLLQKAWQEFATGAHTKADMVRIMKAWGIDSRRGRPLSPQAIDHIFANLFYAGILLDPWSGEEHPGLHVPMVSSEAFACVQQIIRRRNRSIKHERHRPEFPLRGLVRCPLCQHYFTASFSRGRSDRYPYYHCYNRVCEEHGRSVAGALVDNEFKTHLERITPEMPVVEKFETMFLGRAAERDEILKVTQARAEQTTERLDKQMTKLIEMKAQELITDDEFRLHRTALLAKKHELRTQVQADFVSLAELKERFAEIAKFMLNLVPTWSALSQPVRAQFQQTIFPVGYLFGKVRTAETGLLFRAFDAIRRGETNGVPLTYASWNRLEDEIALFSNILKDYHERG